MNNKQEDFTRINMEEADNATLEAEVLPRKSHSSDASSIALLDKAVTKEEPKPTFWQKVKTVFRYSRPLLSTLFIDVAIPLAIYYLLKNYTSILIALIVSGVPPLLHVIYGFIKYRKINILGCIFVFSFIISAVLSIISGDVRLTLLRDSATSAVMSVMFFFTLIPIRTSWFYNRPLIFLINQQMMQEAPPMEWTDIEGTQHSMPRMDWCWDYVSVYKRFCYILNALWGVVLLGEFIAKVVMIELTSLTVDQIVLYGNIIVIVVMVSMTVGTIIVSHRVRKLTAAYIETWLKQNDYSTAKPK